MSAKAATDKEDKALFRQCITALDSFYSQPDIEHHIKALEQVEAKVFAGETKDFESFRRDLSTLDGLSLDALASSHNSNATDKITEENYALPIFSSITYKPQSIMYSVHNKSQNLLNSWLSEIWDTTTATEHYKNAPSLHRLFVTQNGKLLVDARDNSDAILTIFFNAIVTPCHDNTNLVQVESSAVVVHPFGPFHKSNVPGFDGWMKVSIIKKAKVHHVISASLAKMLFQDNDGCVHKISSKGVSDAEIAQAKGFAHAVIANGADIADNFYHVEPCLETELVLQGDFVLEKRVLQEGVPILHTLSYAKELEAEVEKPEDRDESDTQSSLIDPSSVVQHSDDNHDIALDKHWKLLEKYATEKRCGLVYKDDYDDVIRKPIDAVGHFKHVYFTDRDVIQIFQKSTVVQRVTEIACLLKLRKKQHIGHIKQLIRDEKGIEMIGIIMPKYDMTLHEYLRRHTHPRLTSFQRMDIIIQMIKSIKAIHEEGIAHRDLSPFNFMVSSSTTDKLADGSPKVHLYLIDFGKAVFFTPEDAKRWWVNTSNEPTWDQTQVNPKTQDELTIWCRNLPYVMARPDHGYRFYRSIQTLPKTRRDHAILPYLINAPAEDLYSLGVLIWKVFSGKEPWPGVFDVELKKLREIVCSSYHIDLLIDRVLPGPLSTTLLKKLVRFLPEERTSAADVLSWVETSTIYDGLLDELNSIVMRTETLPLIQAEAKQGSKRGAAAEDAEQAPPSKRGRPRKAAQSKNTDIANKPRSYKKRAAMENDEADQDHSMTDAPVDGPLIRILNPPEPKKPKQYYIPTGRPVGRPRKKAKFKPTGRPKGSKNKVYYYGDEENEQEAAALESQSTTEIATDAADVDSKVADTSTTNIANASSSNVADAPTNLNIANTDSTTHASDASTIAEFDATVEMIMAVTSEMIADDISRESMSKDINENLQSK
ncbi:hypothetical protein [Parasitella parasitica]|uniref:Protein kinase domain-containing protein n=1 Tax=Parasitella parasitica TaxID=35722 RepID=A0A0B7MQ27_9FUNG|nr:hypothetical protein [Parasitella parasitica]